MNQVNCLNKHLKYQLVAHGKKQIEPCSIHPEEDYIHSWLHLPRDEVDSYLAEAAIIIQSEAENFDEYNRNALQEIYVDLFHL